VPQGDFFNISHFVDRLQLALYRTTSPSPHMHHRSQIDPKFDAAAASAVRTNHAAYRVQLHLSIDHRPFSGGEKQFITARCLKSRGNEDKKHDKMT